VTDTTRQSAETCVADLLVYLGQDINNDHMHDTPKRVVKAFEELTTCEPFNFTTFPNDEQFNEMIISTHIPFYSLCAHHLLPFFGHAHIAYIPQDRIVGISKLARCVEHYARGFQIQESLTHQVASRLETELDPLGVAVVLEAEHLCMTMRGVEKPGAQTITSAMRGVFLDPQKLARNEFLKLIRR